MLLIVRLEKEMFFKLCIVFFVVKFSIYEMRDWMNFKFFLKYSNFVSEDFNLLFINLFKFLRFFCIYILFKVNSISFNFFYVI